MECVVTLMLPTIELCVFLLLAGLLAGYVCSLALGLAGAPGAALIQSSHSRTQRWLGLSGAIAGELYVSLAFTAVVIRSLQSVLADRTDLHSVPVWVTAFVATAYPPSLAWILSKPGSEESGSSSNRALPYRTVSYTCKLQPLGFLAFLLYPDLMARGWPWLPSIHF